MPEGNDIGSRPLTLRTGGGSDLAQFVQRPSLGWHSDAYGALVPWGNTDPYQALLPTAGDVRQEVTAQRGEKPWYQSAFDFLDQLTGGQAIRAFVKDLAPGQAENPFLGFAKHFPIAHLFQDEDVQAADIREAWGDTNARDGVKNAVINTVIDIVSNPLMLAFQPLAVTKAGRAAALAAGSMQLGKGAQAVAEATRGLYSLGKGLETGQRAMAVFNLFGKELFSLGKIPVGNNPLGFRSMYVGLGNLLDSFFSVLHSNPLLKPMSGVFTFATGIGDPLKRAMFGGATKAAEMARNTTVQKLTSILEASMNPETRKWMTTQSGAWDALLHAAQVGIDRMDEAASFAGSVAAPHLWIGRGKVQDLLRKDPHFSQLWTKAWEEVAQPAGVGTTAIRELYDKYGVPLESEMLAHANLPGRFGIEVSELDRPTFYESVAGAVGRPEAGTPTKAGLLSDIGGAKRTEIQGVVGRARERVMSSYELIQRDVNAGKVQWGDINKYLENHANAMDVASEMDRIGGVLGSSIELAVGPYVHAVGNPRLMKILDKQLFRGSEQYGGKKATNIISTFMKEQNYSSLTTAERNAIFWELGTKITAFQPLKDIVARDAAAPGLVDQVMAKVFDLPFVKAMRRSNVPGDVDVANLFITNPVLNDYHRIFEAAQQHGARALFQSVFHGPIPVDSLDLGRDVPKILEYEQAGHRIVIPSPEPQKIMETRAVGAASQDVMLAERRATAAKARSQIRADMETRIIAGTSDWATQQRHLHSGIDIGLEGPGSDLIESSADNIGVAKVKAAVRDYRDTSVRAETLRLMKLGKTTLSPEQAERVAFETTNLEAAWEATGQKTQGEIQQRLAANKARFEAIKARQAELAAEMGKATRSDAELRSWQQADATIERGRLAQIRRHYADVIESDEAMLAGRFKDKESYVRESIKREAEIEAKRTEALTTRIGHLKGDLRYEADSIGEAIDTLAGQERFRAKQARGDLTKAKGRGLTAMQMNTEMSVLMEAQKLGALNLTDLPPAMREKFLGRSGVKAYVFKKDDWAAVEGFWRHWSHADDWGENKIVDALRRMRNVWAPYVAVNGLGLMPRMRDAVTGVMLNMFGGFRHFGAYADSLRMTKGWVKAVDSPTSVDAFSKGFISRTINGVEEKLSDAEFMQFLQSRGGIGAPGMFGETVVNAGDQMTLGSAHFRPEQWFEKGKFAGKETPLPAVLTDFPSAVLPTRKAADSVYGRWGLRMAQFVDDNTRIANAVDAWKRGMSLDEAVDHMMKWTYDSRRNLTTLERQRIATFIPFYSWAKFVVSRSVETFFKHPGRMAWVDTARRNFMKSVLPGETEADPADIEAVLPKYIAQNYGVPIQNGAKGPEFFMLGSWLPTGEMQQIVEALKGGAPGVGNYIGSKMHPAIKTTIEMAFNHSFQNDSGELETFPGQSSEFLGMSINKRTTQQLLQNFRFLYELDRQNLLGISETKALQHGTATEDEPSWISRLGHSVFGILPKTYPQSIEQAVKIKKREAMDQLGKFAGLLHSRAEHPERVASAEDADALRGLLKTGVAQVARMEALSASFPPDQPAVKRKRKKFGPLTETLTP